MSVFFQDQYESICELDRLNRNQANHQNQHNKLQYNFQSLERYMQIASFIQKYHDSKAKNGALQFNYCIKYADPTLPNKKRLNFYRSLGSSQDLQKIQQASSNQQQTDLESVKLSFVSSACQLQKLQFQQKYSQYLELCLIRILQSVRRGALQQIASILKQQPQIQDQSQLTTLMSKKTRYLLNQLGQCGRNTLHWAIHLNHIDLASFLLIKGANISVLTIDSYTPLQLAVQHRSLPMLHLLLGQTGININQTTKYGTALHLAVTNEDFPCFYQLIRYEIDDELTNQENKTVIQICKNTKMKQLLMKRKQKGKVVVPMITKGSIYRVTNNTYRLKDRIMLLNPFKNELLIYEQKTIEQKIDLNEIRDITKIEQKSWLMKSSIFYFKLQINKKQKDIIIGLRHVQIFKKWMQSFRIAFKYIEYQMFTQKVRTNDQLIQILDDIKNQTVIHKRKVQTNSSFKKSMSIMNLKYNQKEQIVDNNKNKRKMSQQYSDLMRSQLILGSILQFQKHNPNIQSAPSKYAQVVEVTEDQNDITPRKMSFSADNNTPTMFKKTKTQTITISQFKPQTKISVSYRDFEVLKLLGNGSFGKVYLVKFKQTGKTYALKVLNKKKLLIKKQLKYAVSQSSILKKLQCPFIVQLHFSFQTPANLYLALDHCSRGDLSQLIINKQKLDEPSARFIIAQLIIAIEYLHQNNILYRDLKPQNILIHKDGYIRLTDFGLSKQNNFAASFCGSPAYLSPQMLQKKGVGFSSDIYGIGCVLYQMIAGEPPFFDQNLDNLFENIRTGKLRYPSYISIQLKSLLSKLLQRDFTKRIGVKNMNEIKGHDFFKKIDWKMLQRKQLKKPDNLFEDEDNNSFDIELQLNENTKLVDNDYNESTGMINRIKNFTFVRTSQLKNHK